MKKSLVAAALLLMVGSVTAPTKEPTHPLSQVRPIDTDFNLTGKDIGNVTDLEVEGVFDLDNGFRLEENEIRSDSNVELLVYNESESRWEVRNSELDLNDNNLTNFFADACSGSSVVDRIYDNGSYKCEDLGSSVSDEFVDETGDNMTGDLNLSGNDLEQVGNITSYFASACNSDEYVNRIYKNGSYNCISVSSATTTEDLQQTLSEGNTAGSNNINLSGNNLTEAALVDGVNLSSRGQGIDLDSFNRLRIAAGGVGAREIASSAIGTGLTGGSGSDLAVDFGSGSSQAARGNTTVGVSAGTGLSGGGQLTVGDDTSGISLSVAEGGISNTLIALDAVNQSQLAQGNCNSGEVLEWDGSSWNCLESTGLGTDDQSLLYSSPTQPTGSNASQEIGIENGTNITFYDFYNANQTLSVNNNSGGNSDEITISGGNTVAISDSVEDADSNVYNELQSLTVNDNSINDTISISSNNSVTIFDQVNDSDADSTNEIQSVTKSGDQVSLSQDGTSIYVPFANSSDTLDSKEGSYYNQTISVDSSSADDVIKLSTGSQATIDDDTGTDDQNLSEVLSNGNSTGSFDIDLNDNEILNFFSNQCSGSNEVVKRVYANGSYICETVPEDTGVENLNATLEAGNIANQSILMDGNNITSPDQVDGVDLDNPGSTVSISGDQLVVASDSLDDAEVASNALDSSSLASDSVNRSELASLAVTASGNELDPSVAGNELSLSSGALDVDEGFGSGLNADELDGLNSSYLNTTISSITNSGQTQTVTLSNGGSATFTDNVDDADADPTNEYQSLSEVLDNGTSAGDNNIDLTDSNITDVQEIRSFFASACESDEYVNQIYENGSYNCISVSTASTTEDLQQTLSEGNTAGNNDIVMNQSAITDIGTGRTNISSSGSIDAGGNVNLNGNSVTSSSEVCIGDQCA